MTMNCPRDNATLVERRYEANIMVDCCDVCGGIWLDGGELQQIQEVRERDYAKELAELPLQIRKDSPRLSEKCRCPKCTTEMIPEEYAYCSQVVVDICPEGHGIWLDGGEMKALEVFFEKNKDRANAEAGMSLKETFFLTMHKLFGKKKKK